MRWLKGYTRIKVRNSANIEGDPDGATVMPLKFQWQSLSACSILRRLRVEQSKDDKLASNVYVEVQALLAADRQRPPLTMERAGKRDLNLRS